MSSNITTNNSKSDVNVNKHFQTEFCCENVRRLRRCRHEKGGVVVYLRPGCCETTLLSKQLPLWYFERLRYGFVIFPIHFQNENGHTHRLRVIRNNHNGILVSMPLQLLQNKVRNDANARTVETTRDLRRNGS